MITRTVLLICVVLPLASLVHAQRPPVWGKYVDYYGNTDLYHFTYDSEGRPLTTVQRDSTRSTTYSGYYDAGKYRSFGHPTIRRLSTQRMQTDSLDAQGLVVDTLALALHEVVWNEIRSTHTWQRDPLTGDLHLVSLLRYVYDSVAPAPLTYSQWQLGGDTVFNDTMTYTMSQGRIDTLWTGSRKEVYHYDQADAISRVILYDRKTGAPRRMWDSIVLYESPRDHIHHPDLEYSQPTLRTYNNYRRVIIRDWSKTAGEWTFINDLHYEYNADSRPTLMRDTYRTTTYEYYADGAQKRMKTHDNSNGSLLEDMRSVRTYSGDLLLSDSTFFMTQIGSSDSELHFDGAWTFGYEPLDVERASAFSDLLAIYPNPTSGRCSVEAFADRAFDISVTSVTGAEVLRTGVSVGRRGIDLSEFPNGVYFIHVSDGRTSATQKLTLQR